MKRFLKLAWLLVLASCSSSPSSGTIETKIDPQRAMIEGVVLEQRTEVPVSSVKVFVVRPSSQPQLHTTTDGDGKFSLQGLDQGRHLVALVRDGYVVPGRLETSGYPFRVTTGQKISGVVFHLVPAGTLAGRVLGPDGKPANRVEVQLLQKLYLMGQPQWSLVNRGGIARETKIETNERGEFRAIGVDPGQYAVRFVPHEASVEAVIPGGRTPTPSIYPGVRDIAKAVMVEIKPARETTLDDLKLVSEMRGWIRIAVVNETGEPLEDFGNWQVEPPGWMGAEYPLVEQRVVNAYHEIQPDIPGAYDVTAIWSTAKGPLAARARVNYQGADITMSMTLQKPQSSLTGTVMLQEKEGFGRTSLMGVDVAIGPDIPYFIKSNAAGLLRLPSLYPGRYKLGAVRSLPPDTYVSRVSQNGRDVLMEDLNVEKGEVKLDVVVSSGAASIQGKVTDAKGQAAHNALVALVPEGALKSRVDYYGAYQSTRTDQNGEFDIRGITPGSYRAFAWLNAPAAAFRSDAFLQAYTGKETTLKLEMGGAAKIALKALDSTP